MIDRSNTEYYIEPVRYADGLYHIGTRKYPSWLIDCGGEIALLDTAMPSDLDFILENIEKIGYKLSDVKHILHSHGHIDHIGGTKAIAKMTGAKTYIGKGDEDTVAGRNDLQWTKEFGMEYTVGFESDVIISDGDRIKIGNKEFYFLSTPGHTQGTLSIFFDVTDEGKTYRAGMFGGVGGNSMHLEYLDRYGLPHTLRDDFIAAAKRLKNERVDIHLGNHLANSRHFEKAALLGQGKNPFIGSESWIKLLETKITEIERFIKENL